MKHKEKQQCRQTAVAGNGLQSKKRQNRKRKKASLWLLKTYVSKVLHKHTSACTNHCYGWHTQHGL